MDALVNRIEKSKLADSSAILRQLADAYGYLGDKQRQYELLEKRAQLSGRLPDWMDAIDAHYWNRDYKGALLLMDKAEATYPARPQLAERRLLALVELGRNDSAINV